MPLPVGVEPPPPPGRTGFYWPTIIWGTGTGVDTSAYDNVKGFYLNNPGLVVEGIGRDQIRAYAPPAAASFDLTLTNWDGRFSPGGTLGAFVGRGPRCYLDLFWGTDVADDAQNVETDDDLVMANGVEEHRLFDGVVNSAQHVLTRPQRSVQVRALGYLSTLLLDKRPSTSQLYENIRTDEAISVLLDLCGWPADKRVLDTGDTRLVYWWLDGSRSGLDCLNTLLAAEGAGGCAYEQGGFFHFEGRQYRQHATRSLAPQWIFASGGFSSDPSANSSSTVTNDAQVLANGVLETGLLLDINPSEYRSNPDEVVSSVAATINHRMPTATMKVWELGSALTLAPLEVRVTEATARDPFKDALAPQLGTDYTVFSGDLTSVVLLETSGHRVRIEWTAGASGASIFGTTSNGPQLRATSLPVVSDETIRSTTDTTVQQARYSSRELSLEAWPEVGRNQMLDIVNSMCQRYMAERRQAVIRVANLDAVHMAAILHMRVSDRIQWVQRHGGINDPYWIEQISHEIAPGGGLHIVTLGCERVFDLVGGQFDSATFDDGRFGD